MYLLWNACETKSPTVPILSRPVKSSPIFPKVYLLPTFYLVWLVWTWVRKLSHNATHLGQWEQRQWRKGALQSTVWYTEDRETAQVYCQGQPLSKQVWHNPASATCQGSGTTRLLLQPYESPAPPPSHCLPLQERTASAKILLPSALVWHVSVCLSHQHARLLTHCFAHTHSCTGGIFFSFPSWSSCASSLFSSHTHHLVNELIVFDSLASALVRWALPAPHSSW